ncbi:sperm-associated antigen 4 protein-like isoform X2 [Melopsittacus undulatus]|uniref:sperm-associated antigen 4 protein-like isoform X2 n=1 Tax=Melopsittacus undulatus TaxID=13146 RepID=UPI00146DB39B|nr:sperm-associated antigen 4 protein-like isoform X2 [Melopsittacus undulatus]
MARRKAPQKMALNVSLERETDQRSAGEAGGQSHGQGSRSLFTEVELRNRFSQPTPSSSARGPPEPHGRATALASTLASLWRSLLTMCIFTGQQMAVHKKRCLKFIVFLLLMVLAGVYCGTSLPVWTMRAKAQREDLSWASAAETKMLRNLQTTWTEQTQKLQLVLEELAQLRVEISSWKKERQEVNQAALKLALETYLERYDWALKSSGAVVDMQRTSKTYDCKDNWVCKVVWFFHTFNPPDTILKPDVSPGNCWPLQGQQGQVVIRLPARVHLTAVSVQHIYKEVSPSGTVTSAPRDMAVFGLNADREEETLLGMFEYNVAKEALQTFPLKNTHRAFSHIKLVVKSNWGYPDYTCIYRVQVHGKMAEPENLN